MTHVVLWRERGVQTSKTFDDPREAELLKAFLNSNGNSLKAAVKAAKQARGEGPTVAEMVEEHIEGLTDVERRTKHDYRRDARRHIIPALGTVKVGKLTRRNVREWVNQLHESGCAPKSIANYHGLLSAAMVTAMEDGYRADNPCRSIKLPEKRRPNHREVFLELHQYEGLLREIPPKWRPLVQLLAGTGLRWSEATALNVGDVILDAKVPFIVVDKAWKRDDDNTMYIAKPKTPASIRDVTIDAGLAAVLERVMGDRPLDDFLIKSANGSSYLQYQNFQSRVWAPAVTRAMVKSPENPFPLRHRPKIHGLRHSHGSWLIAEGIDLLTVSRRLGHESISTTTGVYGHLSERQQATAAEAIGRALYGLGPDAA